MKIRAATLGDLAAVVNCADQAFLPIIPSDRHSNSGHDDDLVEQIRRQNLHVISVGSDPAIVGYISLVPIKDHVFVDSLAVLPEHRDTGFGTHLLKFAEMEAVRLGLDSVRLYTHQTSTDVFAFYAYRGYTETDRCDRDGFPRVFYCKDVSENRVAASASRSS
jgi:ribosomal protein S18 acetylase RimI-like enzyme